MLRKILIFTLLLILCQTNGWSQSADDSISKDSLERLRMTPDFVRASVCIVSRGDVLYSNTGHAFIRMQCPTFDLDYSFTYEAEDVTDNIFRFYTGNLNMGMMRWTTKEYIDNFKKQGRGIKEYPLNLPPEAKTSLWRILDLRVDEGMHLPYDPVKRGCAHSIIEVLSESLESYYLQIDGWPERFNMSLREMIHTSMSSEWDRFFAHLTSSNYPDSDLSNFDKTVLPSDIIDVLKVATINGQPIITEEPIELLPVMVKESYCPFTPLMMAVAVLLLTIIGMYLLPKHTAVTVTVLQSLVGLFIAYLFLSGNLLGGRWTILIIPFNPLPILLWRWRRYWASVYTLVLVAWILVVWLYPHQLTDPAFPIITIALVIVFLKQIPRMPKFAEQFLHNK